VWTDIGDAISESQRTEPDVNGVMPLNGNGKSDTSSNAWQMLRLARIEHAELLTPLHKVEFPDAPISELRKWSFDNGTAAMFITDKPDLPFTKSLPDARTEAHGEGEKVHLTVSSDSWFVAFCISHARHIVAVAPGTLRTMILARARRELSLEQEVTLVDD
ncbi:MAG: WYL domain-containing protein, partial [Bifidobacterium crudilactis]|nr:WYL domain-containing protein [Bifidobacterium crudilactis]